MRYLLRLSLTVLSACLVAQLLAQDTEKPNDEKQRLLKTIEAQVKETMEGVAEIRGKEYLKTVPVGIKSPNEAKEFLFKAFEEEFKPGELEEMKDVLVKFGVIKPNVDLKDAIVKIVKQCVAGLYVPKEKKLFIMEEVVRNDENNPFASVDFRSILAHELTHALQDQHFGIDAFMRHIYDNNDRIMAAQAVLEGEATLLGTEYVLKQAGMSVLKLPVRVGDRVKIEFNTEKATFKGVPDILLDVLVFPYIYGSNFVQDFVEKYGFKGIDRLFEHPPLSTEQVLHSEKYLSDETDYPTDIRFSTLDRLLGEKEWKLLDNSSCGEYLTRLIAEHFIDEAEAEDMAEGWDGDRYNVIREKKSKRTVLVWFSTWDSAKDAKEFFNSYTKVLQKKYGKKATKNEDTAFFYTDDGHLVWIEMNNNDVLVAETVTKEELEKIRKHIAKAKKIVISDKAVELKERKLELPEPPKKSPKKKEGEEKPEEF